MQTIYAMIFLGLTLQVSAMEQKIEIEKKVERNQPVFYVDPEIQKKLNELQKSEQQDFHDIQSVFGSFSMEVGEVANSYNRERAEIVLSAKKENISNAAKLKYLIGDSRYKERKKIVKEMIENEQIHPDDIRNDINQKFMHESFMHDDVEFAEYLLKHGADVQKGLKKIKAREKLYHLSKDAQMSDLDKRRHEEKCQSNKKFRTLLELYAKKSNEQK